MISPNKTYDTKCMRCGVSMIKEEENKDGAGYSCDICLKIEQEYLEEKNTVECPSCKRTDYGYIHSPPNSDGFTCNICDGEKKLHKNDTDTAMELFIPAYFKMCDTGKFSMAFLKEYKEMYDCITSIIYNISHNRRELIYNYWKKIKQLVHKEIIFNNNSRKVRVLQRYLLELDYGNEVKFSWNEFALKYAKEHPDRKSQIFSKVYDIREMIKDAIEYHKEKTKERNRERDRKRYRERRNRKK